VHLSPGRSSTHDRFTPDKATEGIRRLSERFVRSTSVRDAMETSEGQPFYLRLALYADKGLVGSSSAYWVANSISDDVAATSIEGGLSKKISNLTLLLVSSNSVSIAAFSIIPAVALL
jgi:hypothetical protein